MAYTAAPETQTYGSQRLPAAHSLDMRIGAFGTYGGFQLDSGMYNLVPRINKNPVLKEVEIHAESRQPIVANTVATTSNAVRGTYVWEKSAGTIYYFVVIGTSVYTSTTGLAGSWTAVDTLLTNVSTRVGFTEYIDDVNTKKLILVDGVEGYVYTSNAAGTKIVDADFPTPHLPFPIFIDGYLFLAKANTGDIYNSVLNDPASWVAGDFISSELYPDDVQALVKVNNYLLAIGRTGCEYFYDAANATGSPLARYEGGSLPFGCSIPSSIAVNENTVVMLANMNDGETSLVLIEDFKHKTISPDWLVPYINDLLTDTDISSANCRGFFIRQSGEIYYCLRLPGETTATATSGTFVYSFVTEYWTQFGIGTSGLDFGVMATAFSTSNNLTTFVAGNYSGTAFFGTIGPSFLASYFTTYGQDYITGATAPIPIVIETRTPLLDFGTMNAKTMHRFGVDLMLNDPEAANAVVIFEWADEDASGTTGARTVTYNRTFPFVTQLGQFRRRSLRIYSASPYSFRIRGFEVDLNKGQQ